MKSRYFSALDRIRDIVRDDGIKESATKAERSEATNGKHMHIRQHTGASPAAIKYDLLTALSIAGLNGETGFQLSMMRLMSLITARYNWRNDTLTIGQREMSELWGVGERTAKREVKRWLDSGVLICTRPGVRGRVATYRLNISRVCELSRHVWDQVGPDFAERMSAIAPREDRVIHLESVRAIKAPAVPGGAGGWEAASYALAKRFPSQHPTWIAPLKAREVDGRLLLEARSGFAAEYIKTHFGRDIHDAVQAEWPAPITVVIRGADLQRNG